MSEVIQYIVEHPIYCLIILLVIVFAWIGGPHSDRAIRNKRNALINKKYNDTFKH